MRRLLVVSIALLFCFSVMAEAIAGGQVWARKSEKGVVFEYEGRQGGFSEIQKNLSSGFNIQGKSDEFRVLFDADV